MRKLNTSSNNKKGLICKLLFVYTTTTKFECYRKKTGFQKEGLIMKLTLTTSVREKETEKQKESERKGRR